MRHPKRQMSTKVCSIGDVSDGHALIFADVHQPHQIAKKSFFLPKRNESGLLFCIPEEGGWIKVWTVMIFWALRIENRARQGKPEQVCTGCSSTYSGVSSI